MPLGRPSTPDDPWWYRALEPVRSEEGMFRLLLMVAGVCAALIALVVVVRAVL